MQQLSVSVLGSVRVTRDGGARPMSSRRQRALLAALAVRHPGGVSVDDLIEAVWDEAPPDRARTTLQTYVSRLRTVLGEDAVVHDAAGYRLAAETTVDAEVARIAAVRAQRLSTTDPAAAAAEAQRALALWDGTALAELADRAWFRPVAIALETVRDNLRDVLAAALVADGRALEAVELLEVVVGTHPFREPAQLLLVRALAEAGRQVDALRAADRYRSLLREETGLDPGPELARLEAAVLSGDVRGHQAPPDQPPAPSLLAPRRAVLPRSARLVGREHDVAELAELLREARLVTVLGTGGVGKTRLAAEVLADRAPDSAPAIVVELATVGTDEVADTVAAALGYRAGRADPATLVEVLADEHALLVLDNCEHVVTEVAGIVRKVLAACPNVSVLATSRTRLGLADEHVVPLQPLDTAGDRPPAVELFEQCFRRSHPRTDLDVAGGEVRRLCQLLDGIPLALELAAARAALLGVGAMADRLSSSTATLTAPGAEGGGRHDGLHEVVRWSYDLLGPTARRLLAILGTFESEFDLDAVERVAGAVLDEPVAPAFARLIDTCMVALGSRPERFRLLDLVRRFSADRLAASGDEVAARGAHARWVASEVAAIAGDAIGTAESTVTDRLDAARADIRAAVGWAMRAGDDATVAAIAGGIARSLLYRPDAELAGLVLDAACRSAPDAAEDVVLSAAGARCGCLLGDLETAQQLADRALALEADDSGSSQGRHLAQHALGMLNLYRGRFEAAARAFEEVVADPGASPVDRLDAAGGAALAATYAGDQGAAAEHAVRHRALAEASASETATAFAGYIEAERALAAAEPSVALRHLERAAQRAWAVGATFVWGLASTVLVATLVGRGDHTAAARQLPVLLRRWRRTATWPQLWTSLRLVADVLAAHGKDADAAMVLAAADRDAGAHELGDADQARVDALRRTLHERLGAEGRALAEARAEVLDRAQVLEAAIRGLEELAG